MHFVEIKYFNDSFEGILNLDEIHSIVPSVEIRDEFKNFDLGNGRKLESFSIPNKNNSDIKFYGINLKNGRVIQISVEEYKALNYKIKKLQEGIL